jgi:hypothetical protein
MHNSRRLQFEHATLMAACVTGWIVMSGLRGAAPFAGRTGKAGWAVSNMLAPDIRQVCAFETELQLICIKIDPEESPHSRHCGYATPPIFIEIFAGHDHDHR